jgi:AcrR family transcriptional regulator
MSSSWQRRTTILQAATRLFEHYGHAKTTIADVAREAQVGVGTVYLEFESKEAIVQALSLSTHVAVLEAMQRAAAAASTDDHATRLAAVLRARTASFLALRSRGQHACELVHCKTEGVINTHQRFREDERALLESIIRQGQRAGSFAEYDPPEVARTIQRAYASLSPPWIFGPESEDSARASEELCRLLLHGLLATKAPGAPAGGAERTSSKRAARPARGR